jgi:integrase
MSRPRDQRKPRWTSRRYAVGFVENYRDGGVCYARIGDWRKSLAPLRFVAANRVAAVRILERLIEVRAYDHPPSRTTIAGDGSVRIEAVIHRPTGSLFAHMRNYRLRREAEGLGAAWTATFKSAAKKLLGEDDLPLDADIIRQVVGARLAEAKSGLTEGRPALSLKSKSVYIAILRPMFVDAVRTRLLAYNPLDDIRVKVPERPIELYSVEEETAILAAIAADPQRWRLRYFQLIRLTAMRRAEAAGLTRSDVDFDRGVIRIHGKGNRVRLFPLRHVEGEYPLAVWSRGIHGLVRESYDAARPSGELFGWINPKQATDYLEQVRKDLGHVVPDGRAVHTFRKIALSEWEYQFGFPEKVQTLWAGNTARTRAKHYLRSTEPADTDAAITKLLRQAVTNP